MSSVHKNKIGRMLIMFFYYKNKIGNLSMLGNNEYFSFFDNEYFF
jgi:hypothetical protein